MPPALPVRRAVRALSVFALVIVAALSAAGCSRPAARNSGSGQAADNPAPADPPDLGSHSYRITTSSGDAQRGFDRGLTLAYGFSHGAAEREFRKAAELDPQCAMAYWGIALVNGPHINFPMVPPDKAKAAWDALTKARSLSGKTTTERALIDALVSPVRQPAARGPPPARRGLCRCDARRVEGPPARRGHRDAVRGSDDGPAPMGPLDGGRQATARH